MSKVNRYARRAAKEDGYGFLGKTFFSFDREQYERAFRKFFEWMCMGPTYDVDEGHWTNYVDLSHYEGGETSVEDFFKWLRGASK